MGFQPTWKPIVLSMAVSRKQHKEDLLIAC